MFWTLSVNGEAVSSRECSYLRGHTGRVCSLLALTECEGAFGGGLVVSGGADSSIRVWDPRVREGENACVQTMFGHEGSVTALVQVGPYIVSGSTDKTVRLWRAGLGRKAAMYPWFEEHARLGTMDGWIQSLSFNVTHKVGDLGAVYAADSTGAALCFKPRFDKEAPGKIDFAVEGDASGGGVKPFNKLLNRAIIQIKFLAEENMVLTLAYDNKLRVYDSRSGMLILTLDNSNLCAFHHMEWDGEHRQLYLVDRYGYLWVWDLVTESVVFKEQMTGVSTAAREEVRDQDYQPAIGIALWHQMSKAVLLTPKSCKGLDVSRESDYAVVRGGHDGPVIAFAVGAVDGQERIFSASLDNTIRQWDPYDLALLRVFEEYRSEVSCMTFVGMSRRLVTGHDDGSVRLWDLDTGSTVNLREPEHGHSNTVSCACVIERNGGEEQMVATGGFDGRVGIWETRKTRHMRPHLIAAWDAHKGSEILCIAAFGGMGSARGGRQAIITAGNDKVIKLWRDPNDLAAEFRGHAEAITCMALDGNFLYSGSEDRTIKVWDAMAGVGVSSGRASPSDPRESNSSKASNSTRALVKTLEGHTQAVVGVKVLAMTGHLLSIAVNGTLLAWDPNGKGTIISKFEHHDTFRCMAVRERDNQVLIGTMEDNIIVHFALPEELRETLGLPPKPDNVPPTPEISSSEDEPEESDDEYGDIDEQFVMLGGEFSTLTANEPEPIDDIVS